MVSLNLVRESNRNIKSTFSGQISLFIGATSGIALSTLTEYVRHSNKPKVYIVGRSDATLAGIIADLKQLNPDGSYVAIKSEVSLLKNVDAVCAEVKDKEKSLDLLVMAPGYLKYKRIDNAEGLEDTMSLRYYARMRFIHALLPLLLLSASPRVLSIQGAGKEGVIDATDFELRHSYSMRAGAVHTNTMNSLALQHLSAQNPAVSFLHCFPGLVMTPAFATTARDWPVVLRWAFLHVVLPLMWPISLGLGECGERQAYHATSARYPPAKANNTMEGGGLGAGAGAGAEFVGSAGVTLPKGAEIAKTWDGRAGGGFYLVDWNGEMAKNGKLMREYEKKDMSGQVWEHTLEVFARILGKV